MSIILDSCQSRTKIHLAALLPLFFIVSYVLLNYYTEGDQIHYHRFYEALKYSEFSDVPSLAVAMVSSREIISPYLLWVGASLGIDKNIYISALNVILLSGVYLLLRKNNVSWLVVILILTNFYTVVLLTSAERLKIAFILVTYGVYFSGWVRNILLFFSPMAHFQALLFFPSIIFNVLEKDVKSFFMRFTIRKSSFRVVMAAMVPFFFMALFFWDGVFTKISWYVNRDTSVFELANILILSIVAVLATKHKLRILMILLPFYPMIALLGGIRVNMLAVVAVIYFLMVEKKLNHPAMVALLIYFSFKSIPFVHNVIVYGNGFA